MSSSVSCSMKFLVYRNFFWHFVGIWHSRSSISTENNAEDALPETDGFAGHARRLLAIRPALPTQFEVGVPDMNFGAICMKAK